MSHGLAPAAGWVKGRMSDPVAVAESIRAAVTDAERGAQVSVEAVTVGIGGMEVRGAQSRGLYEFGRPHELDAGDLEYAVELAADVRLERDRTLLHVLPQNFTLDGRAGFRRPRKSVCSRLEAHVHIVTAAAHEHQALVSAAHLAHIAVEETVFEPLAAAYACVHPEARARGVAVLDLGMQSTDLVIYDGDAMLLAASIPVWGDHLTRDIATIFKVTYEDAECLKHEYGCALLGMTADSSLIEVPSPEGRASREARRSELNEILEARAEELFLYVRSEIHRVGHGAAPLRRHHTHGRRRAAERHVRHGRARPGLPGRQRHRQRRRHRRLAGRVEEPAVDRRSRARSLFGEVEIAPAAVAAGERPDGFGFEINRRRQPWHSAD